MFREGLPGEVKALCAAGFGPEDPGLKAIGYKEFFVENFPEDPTEASPEKFRISADLKGVEALTAQNSRHYAKRQITFFASIPGVKWIDASTGDPVQEIRRELTAFLGETVFPHFPASGN
jgi:tRNA dimethylallyltransferase